jgi:hypothetical protein
VRNESVDGEAAMLNTMRHEDEDAKEDAHIWIPKAEDYHFAMNRMWLSEGKREKNIAQHDLSANPGAGSSCAHTRSVNHG